MKPASKQRPSIEHGRSPLAHATRAGSAAAEAKWSPRLYRNSYTRDGRRFVLGGWAIKIQHRGQRRTFSLWAKTKISAVTEAKAIYDTIVTEGWEAALRNHPRRTLGEGQFPKTDVRYWRNRLLVRRYRFPASGESENDFSARIDHAGTGYWFPLGTSDPQAAAIRAHTIHQNIVEQGWETACRNFSRELMVGFEWCSDPILWTYTTLHTLVGQESSPPGTAAAASADSRRILIAESDPGLRRALEWSVNQHAGFRSFGCDSADAFGRAFDLHKPHLVLLNHNLAERIGFDSPGRLAPIRRGIPALTFSAMVDGDQLFVSTPGGAEGYVLKRVQPARSLEPILTVTGPPNLAADDLLSRVKSYFRQLLQPRANDDNSAIARLTRREREVLALLSKGCVDKEIAQALNISAWTVHGHIKKIFERLSVRTRTEAVVRYLEK